MPNLRNLISQRVYLTPVLNTVNFVVTSIILGRINVLLLVKLVVVVDRKITLPLNVQKHKRKSFVKSGAKPKIKKKSVSRVVDESYSECDDCSDVEWVNYTTFVDEANKAKDIKCKMLIDDKSITFQIDTGATVNYTLPVSFAKNVQKSNKVLSVWNNSIQKP